MPETENITKRNLYEILNGFNAVFGHECKIRAGIAPCDGHLYFEMRYDIPTPADKQKSWGSRVIHPDAVDNMLNYGMMKIWVDHDEKAPESRPKFTLWYDNIYCNPYIMPDHDLATQLESAREEYFGGPDKVFIGKEEVYISNKLLRECIASAEKRIRSYHEMMNGVSFAKPSIRTIAEYAEKIINTYSTLRLLLLENKYRTGELPAKSAKNGGKENA